MPLRLVAVTLDAPDPDGQAVFWAALLDRDPVHDAASLLLPGSPAQVGLRLVPGGHGHPGRERVHLHVTTADEDDRQRTVATALASGGRHLDVGRLPEEGHIVLGDPGGEAFCVIEPGNTFLAGCGRLGEIACDGTRDVGLFWRDALGWPLVWDTDEETAIQSPVGGTKIAWGGPPVAVKVGRNRQRFELATTDLGFELERLAGMGAIRLAERDGGVELADPDGNEFLLRAER